MDKKNNQEYFSVNLALFALFGIHLIRYLPFILHAQIANGFEDGFIFLSQAWNGGYTSLFTSYQKYFHTIQRIVALSSTCLPIDFAPYVFSFGAFLLHFLPVPILMSTRSDEITGSNNYLKFLLAALYILLPVSNEVYGTLTNIHWNLQVWFLLIFFSKPSKHRIVIFFEYVLIVLYSVSGLSVLFFTFIWVLNLLFLKPVETKLKLFLLCLPGCMVQLFGLLFLTNDIDLKVPDTNPVTIGGVICRLFWTNFTGLFTMKFISGICSKILFSIIGLLSLFAIFYRVWKSKNEFWKCSFALALLIFIGGLFRIQSISIDGLSGTRFSLLFTWTLLSYCALLSFTETSKWVRTIFTFILLIVMCVAIPFDFRINNDKKENWHTEILKYYYPAKIGDTIHLKNASCSLIRKNSSVKTLASWQKLFLKKEVLWQNNETLVPVPDIRDFILREKKLIPTTFSDIGPLEITLTYPTPHSDKMLMILEGKNGKFAFPVIPVQNDKNCNYYVLINKRSLPRYENYKITFVDIDNKIVSPLTQICKTAY